MSFLLPIFLLGGLAVALPVIFHLIRRSTRDRKPFSSLMFLLASPPRLTRRSRLEHWLLLVLRCLVLCLIALAFARPFLKQPVIDKPSAGAPRRIAILVDTSASMRRANLWPDARARVEAFLSRLSPADQAALFAFDRQLRPVLNFEQWNAAPAGERAALASAKLAEMSPGWSSTHLGNALIGAAEALAEPAGQPAGEIRQVLLVSDLQEGSRLDQLQGYEWPKGIQLLVETLKPRNRDNAALHLVVDGAEADPKEATGIRVRVSNSAESRREQFRVGWAAADGSAFAGQDAEVYVPAGQSRVVLVPLPAGQGTNSQAPSRVLLRGDAEDFDNSVFVIPPEPLRLRLIYFGKDTEQDPRQPRFFLQRAFPETRVQTVKVVSPAPDPALAELNSASLLVVADPLPDAQAGRLRDSVAAGQTLLFVAKDAAAGSTLARLLGLERVDLEEAKLANYAMFGEIDFRHPLFSGFADPRYSDFTRIHFWKYRKLDSGSIPGARVLAKFDSGDPALLEVPVGRGRVFVLTSGWQPADSQLALSTKFVPLLYALLDQTGRNAQPPTQYHIDDVIALAPAAAGPQPVDVSTPEGKQISLSGIETNFSQTSAPGIYQLASAGETRRLAVNLDASESRTSPLPPDELERLGAPISVPPSATVETARQVRLQNSELEGRQKIWRWILAATLAVLLLETWLSGRASRRLAPAGGARDVLGPQRVGSREL